MQNINYGNLIYNKIKVWFVFSIFDVFRFVEMYFCIFRVFCIINCYFYCVYRIRCHFLYIWRYFKVFLRCLKKRSQKCEQFSYELSLVFFVNIFLNFGNKWSPTPTPIPGVNVKVPFRGENMENCFWYFYENWKKRNVGTSKFGKWLSGTWNVGKLEVRKMNFWIVDISNDDIMIIRGLKLVVLKI